MTLEFKEDVFVETDKVVPAPTPIAENNDFDYSITCTLGNCNMEYAINDQEYVKI